jgi:hypothetical protein
MEPTMRARLLAIGCNLLVAVTVEAALAASTEADFKTAIAAAETAEKDAGTLKNQWTTTEQALAAAKKASAAGDFDAAVKQANYAEALAKASIAQAKEQETAWRAGVIR